MKLLVFGLTFAAIALAQHPKVSECFKVHELLRADEEHYWATWTNACPYTIDAVYVTVRFADRTSSEIANGVWSLHFVPPGAHRTMRFSAPGKIADFTSVHQKRITSDMGEAFGRPMTEAAPVMSSIERAAVSAYQGAVVKDAMPVSTAAAYKEAVLKDVLANTAGAMAAPAARPVIIGDPGEASFRTDFPDPWRSVLSPQESSVSVAPRGSFVRFVSDDKPIFR